MKSCGKLKLSVVCVFIYSHLKVISCTYMKAKKKI